MLTDKAVERLRAKAQRYRVTDSDGLYIEVMPTKRKFWRVRMSSDGGTKVHTLGEWPMVSIYDARAQRDLLKQEKQKTPPMQGVTFQELAEEWNIKKNMPSAGSAYAGQKYRWLELYVYPFIGDRPVNSITPREVLELAQMVERRGWRQVPQGVVQTIGCVLRYGIITGQAERDVTADLRGALAVPPSKHHPTLHTKEELRSFLRLIWSLRPGATRRLLLFVTYTFVRSSEARLATWDEFDFSTATWKIPEKRMKMRRPHIVPLSRQAIEILQEDAEFRPSSQWVFPSPLCPGAPMNKQVMISLLRSLGYKQNELTVHGLRAVASTTLYENNWPSDVIERQLAHSDRNRIRAAYNYAQYLDKRREMMTWYADYLDGVRDEQS